MTDTIQLLLLTAICWLLWTLVNRQRGLEDVTSRLDRLEEIRAQVAKLAARGGDLDLRRLEHVLIDIRDGQKRLEERLLQLAEAAQSSASSGAPTPTAAGEGERKSAVTLGERVTNRLLAMGYERIQLVTSHDELQGVLDAGGSGDVLVEARRAGATCKGRVTLRNGGIAGVELKSTHAMFP
ncbi:MAG: hypothetical protein H6828_09785 [Planctomycetes bacterium]|nr:hypothetical protein [Planctomycetota bacterium]